MELEDPPTKTASLGTFDSRSTPGSYLDIAVGPTEPAVPTEAGCMAHGHSQSRPVAQGWSQHGEEQEETQGQLHLSSVMLVV